MSDRIEKVVDLKATVERVWRAVTDHKEFGEWFQVILDQPFTEGGLSTGKVTHPGCEHMVWHATVEKITPKSYFAFKWCPYGGEQYDDLKDPAEEVQTLVEFKLEAVGDGTKLTIIESGFDKIPPNREPLECIKRNTQGWDGQAENIRAHVNG